MILSLLMSFADWDIISPAKFRGLGNFREAFTEDPSFYASLWATLKYTAFSVPLGIIGSMALALLLNQKVKGVAIYRSLYYLPSISSFVAASLIWRRLFNPEGGLVNAVIYGSSGHSMVGDALSRYVGTPDKMVDWLGNQVTALPAIIIMSLWGIGGGMVIFLAGLQGIPQHYYEAATLDGAGAVGKFRNVTLPLLTPTIFFTLITGLIGSLQVFTQAFIMTQGGPNDATRFFVYHLYLAAFDSVRMGYASALGWILFAIVLVFTLIQVRGSKWVYYEADTK
ncbi:sugar ABC transporter permease [bacterium]|nr:MAG: sugar ABC transporter permease [bacterium]